MPGGKPWARAHAACHAALEIVPRSGAIARDNAILVLNGVCPDSRFRRVGSVMNARWNNIVRVAREVEDAFAKGGRPEGAAIMRLARGVLDFQQQLVGTAFVRPLLSASTRVMSTRLLPPPR